MADIHHLLLRAVCLAWLLCPVLDVTRGTRRGHESDLGVPHVCTTNPHSHTSVRLSCTSAPRYLHQGAEGFHVGLLRVQEGHGDMFPHILWKRKREMLRSCAMATGDLKPGHIQTRGPNPNCSHGNYEWGHK